MANAMLNHYLYQDLQLKPNFVIYSDITVKVPCALPTLSREKCNYRSRFEL